MPALTLPPRSLGMTLNTRSLALTLPARTVSQNPYHDKLLALFGSSIVGYWPMWEPSGSVSTDIGGRSHNGAYTAVTLGQTGIGDGQTAASFNGSTSVNNIYSAGLSTDFNPSQLTFMIWGNIAAGVWSDANTRYFTNLQADSSNRVELFSSGAGGNALVFRYRAGGTIKAVTVTPPSAAFHLFALTIDKTGDAVKAYVDSTQQGTTQTGLGVWAGALLSVGTVIGAQNTTPVTVMSGVLAHAILLNRAATAAEIAIAATVP